MQKTEDGVYVIPVRPCPSWCTDTELHIQEHPGDRRCYGEEIRFAASKGEPVRYATPDPRIDQYGAPEVEVMLTRQPDDDDTLVLIHHGEGTKNDAELHLTVDEAKALLDALESVLATHRTAVNA